jgi:hypothetical protein
MSPEPRLVASDKAISGVGARRAWGATVCVLALVAGMFAATIVAIDVQDALPISGGEGGAH